MLIVDCVQGEEAWFKEKLGKPSASNISKIIGTSGKRSTQRAGYMDELAGEIITGERDLTGFTNGRMETGNEREEESRQLYEIHQGVEIQQVGVVYKDDKKRFLCSPDGLIVGSKTGIEMKNVIPKTQVKRRRENKLPTEYSNQCQFSLFVTGYENWHFWSYCPKLKPLLIVVERNEDFIKLLEIELNLFCNELDALVEKVK